MLGGGLEIALACDLRVAATQAAFGLPEVNLGIIPGAGGTQRLPRLIGVAPALDLITSGRSIAASEALRLGLIDAIEEDPLAVASRTGLVASRKASSVDIPAEAAGEIRSFRPKKPSRAAQAAMDAVQIGLRSFTEGIARERELFLELRNGREAEALRYLFFAETAAPKPEGLHGKARTLKQVGVIGAGTIGTGIAAALLLAGLDVVVLDRAKAL